MVRQFANHAIGGLEHRRAGEAAGFIGILLTRDRFTADGGVGGGDAVNRMLDQELGNRFDLFVVKVGRNLHQQGNVLAMPIRQAFLLALHALHDAGQLIVILQLAQVFGVGR